jgi:hypothetical protein
MIEHFTPEAQRLKNKLSLTLSGILEFAGAPT